MSMRAAAAAPTAPSTSPGRPAEIEEWSNRRLIHPLSRALTGLLIPTGVSPNAVSAMGAGLAAIAACVFVLAPWPASGLVGLLFLLAWHVFDGADGDLARRTGRASTNGELVDGICDHLGQAAVYIAFAVILSPSLGGWAWLLAAASGLSRAVQASAYETCRRKYRRWVYGAGWIDQDLRRLEASDASPGQRTQIALARAYMSVAGLVSADDRALEAAMSRASATGPEAAAAARALYRERMLPLVKQAAILCANYRSLAAGLSIVVGRPVWFLLYELVLLNGALVWLRWAEGRANRAVTAALEG